MQLCRSVPLNSWSKIVHLTERVLPLLVGVCVFLKRSVRSNAMGREFCCSRTVHRGRQTFMDRSDSWSDWHRATVIFWKYAPGVMVLVFRSQWAAIGLFASIWGLSVQSGRTMNFVFQQPMLLPKMAERRSIWSVKILRPEWRSIASQSSRKYRYVLQRRILRHPVSMAYNRSRKTGAWWRRFPRAWLCCKFLFPKPTQKTGKCLNLLISVQLLLWDIIRRACFCLPKFLMMQYSLDIMSKCGPEIVSSYG